MVNILADGQIKNLSYKWQIENLPYKVFNVRQIFNLSLKKHFLLKLIFRGIMEKTKYMNPYLAGFLLGLVLLMTIYITGRGLGASGAVKSCVVSAVNTVADGHTKDTKFYTEYKQEHPENPLKSWLVFEVVGVILGAFIRSQTILIAVAKFYSLSWLSRIRIRKSARLMNSLSTLILPEPHWMLLHKRHKKRYPSGTFFYEGKRIMTKSKKLSKLKNDIKFFDKNGNFTCTFNQCRDKFIEDEEVHTVYPKWKNFEPMSSVQVFHRCTECGKKMYGQGDKSKTYYNYLSAVSGQGPATPAGQETPPPHKYPHLNKKTDKS